MTEPPTAEQSQDEVSNLELIRERLRRVSLLGGPFNAQQMFDDARDLLVMVDDLRATTETTAQRLDNLQKKIF